MPRNAAGFDRIATQVFAPLYPVVARRLLSWAGTEKGLCVDLGAGPGLLGIEVAAHSEMEVLALDRDPEMLSFAGQHIREAGLSGRVGSLLGDVHALPFCDNTVDLFVSRGSIFFWEDRPRAFSEIFRALAPGGTAYLGGSFGTPAIKEEIFAEMRRRNPHWDEDVARRSGRGRPATLTAALSSAGLHDAGIKDEETGFWVEIKK
ncbi:ubiquinone/menaquinone biosynthesis C-methylase UbiE [Methanofollis sp. W23]|uniref:class I SAM-dependent methyltransferase n=1 Tax=Methanofollis sp. W23 TaxID=2817849 RepID=UPI001AE51A0E|nr:class I SAM-dependent methyltransferase [Methanofollis sp. W23]MBP2146728.1 ubiquinone/menaquinone biosynthesis C-methylase UbiE [Methanofollis sp. W23]